MFSHSFPVTLKSLDECNSDISSDSDLTQSKMEDLDEINFQCIIEGQNYEESLKKSTFTPSL